MIGAHYPASGGSGLMANHQAALRTIKQGLNTSQIGTPVAARVVIHDRADHGQILPLAAEAMAQVAAWWGQEPDHLTARGNVESGQVTMLAKFPAGASVVVSAGSSGVGRPLVAVDVWGSRGVLSWQDDCPASSVEPVEPLSPQAETFQRRLQQLLRSGPATPQSSPPGVSRGRSNPMAPPYGVLLVSGDHTHQPGYAEALAGDKRCRLVGLTDEPNVPEHRRKLNEQLAQRLGIPVFDDMQAALDRDDVQIVSICAEPYRRGPIAVLAARAGKHLYLDKPLAGSLAHADAIVEAVSESGVVGHMFSQVHSVAARRVRSLVASGELGDLTAIHFDLCFAKGPAGTAALGQRRAETAVPDRFELVESKRELSNVGVYSLVQLLTLVAGNVREVTASTGNYFFREHQQDDMEDFGQMLLELDGGLTASITAGRTGWHSHPGGGLNRVCLIGTKGCAMVDSHRPRVDVWADIEPWKPPARNPDDPMGMWSTPPGSRFEIAPRTSWLTPRPADSMTDAGVFLDCIEQGQESMVSATVAAAATEILLAGYQSAASGKTVTLPLSR